MRYYVVGFLRSRRFGVVDACDPVPVAAGMTEAQAVAWALRLNLRDAWGI